MLRFVPFYHRIMDGMRFIARLFGIVSAVGAFHRLRRLTPEDFIHRCFQFGSPDFPGRLRLFDFSDCHGTPEVSVHRSVHSEPLSQGRNARIQPLPFLPLLAIVAAPTQ